jgi:putative PEP-CTERM system TPR-repeat lipoprotein
MRSLVRNGAAAHYLLILLVSLILSVIVGCSDSSPESLLAKAGESRDAGDPRTASIHLKSLLQDVPDSIDGRVMLGEVSLDLGDAPAAEKEFRRALELGAPISRVRAALGKAMLYQRKYQDVLDFLHPEMTIDANERKNSLLVVGMAHHGLGNTDAAADAFDEALEIDPEFIEAVTESARLLMELDKQDEAQLMIARAMAIDPDDIDTLLLSAAQRFQVQDFTGAESTIRRVLEIVDNASGSQRPAYIVAMSQLAELQLAQNNEVDALGTTEELLAVDQGIYPRFLSARVAAQSGDPDTATSILLEILRDNPQYQPADRLLGTIYVTTGNLPQARMYLERALLGDPRDLLVRRLLAELSLRQNDPQKAMLLLRPVISAEGNGDPGILALAGQASLLSGDRQAAAEFFNRSISFDAENMHLRLSAATLLVLAGELDQAEALLEGIPEDGDAYAGVQTIKVIALIRDGNIDQAAAMAQLLIDENPDEVWSHNLLGSVHFSTGDLSEAIVEFERAHALDPENLLTLHNLAKAELYRQNSDAAMQHLNAILKIDENNYEALVSLARIEIATGGNMLDATKHLEHTMQTYPNASEPRMILASLYLTADDPDSAEQLLSDVVDVVPNNSDAHNLLGLAYLKMGDTGKASRNFRRAIQLSPNQGAYYLNLSQVELIQNDSEGALRSVLSAARAENSELPTLDLLIAIEPTKANDADMVELFALMSVSAPETTETRFVEGAVRFTQGRFADAAAAYDAAYAATPNQITAIRSYEAHARAGHAQVTSSLQSWVADNPANAEGLFALASATEQHGDIAAAQQLYENILQSSPNHAATLNNLAMIYYRQGDDRALPMAERAYESASNHPVILDTLGWILVESGDVQRGAALLDAAAGRSDEPEIKYHLGVALLRSGDHVRARRVLTDLVTTDAEFEGRDNLADLIDSLED